MKCKVQIVIQYLIEHHFDKSLYNQDANYVFLDRPVNISIGKKAPHIYLKEVKERCLNKNSEQTGLINDIDKFYANLEIKCVPLEAMEMDFNSYETFLDKRRKLMAAKIKMYYYSL